MPLHFENEPMEFVSKRWDIESEEEDSDDDDNNNEMNIGSEQGSSSSSHGSTEGINFSYDKDGKHDLYEYEQEDGAHSTGKFGSTNNNNNNNNTSIDYDNDNEMDEVPLKHHSLPSVEEILAMYNYSTNRFNNGTTVLDSNNNNSKHSRFGPNRVFQWVKSRNTKRVKIVLAVIVAVIVLLILTMVVNNNNNNNTNVDNTIDLTTKPINTENNNIVLDTPQFTGRNSNYAKVVQYLTTYNVSSIDDLTNDKSYQFETAMWITNYDTANVVVPDITTDINTSIGYLFIARYIIALNYFTFGGSKSTQWIDQYNFLSSSNICSWTKDITVNTNTSTGPVRIQTSLNFFEVGIVCDTNMYPTKLLLNNNGLIGRIPSENGKLTSLQKLQLEKNRIEGTIPTELCQLTNLIEFDIGINQLSGSIPACIGTKLTKLQTLHLHRNQLVGSIPIEIGKLSELINFNIGHNELVGEAISIFSNLTKIQNMRAPGNQLEGIIDDTFFIQSTNLLNLNLANNKFTSTNSLPSHLLNNMPNLKILSLSKNNLHGTIPDVTNTHSTMLYLSLYDNYLSGNITKTLSNIRTLQHLDLTNNQLSGDIPTELGTMSSLKFLSIANNEYMNLSPIPTFLSLLGNLKYLSLRNTNRNGTIPFHLPSKMNKLQYLDLSYNKLTGPLPIEMYSLSTLEVLMLNSNQIDGAVMGLAGNWADLHVAVLDGMELRGNLNPMCDFITAERNEILYADCDSTGATIPFVNCTCCKCCISGKDGCSRDYVTDLDKRLEYVYRTSDYITSIADALNPNFSALLCSKEGICN